MGSGGRKKPLPEIAETRAAGKDAAFEAILDRVEEAGGEITKDEISPYYTEVGSQEFETATIRVVEFTLNKMDFQLNRRVDTHILQGNGNQKHVEKLDIPRSNVTMKKKEEYSTDWVVVDLEDMF